MMTAPHLPDSVTTPPTFLGCVPLQVSLGQVDGHELWLLSVERWDAFSDLRFARVDHTGQLRLTRRVPPAANWQIQLNGRPATVFDAVGRGDRSFSNGELRIVPPIGDGDLLTVTVALYDGAPPLEATVPVHTTEKTG
jgi:hypothetical protein